MAMYLCGKNITVKNYYLKKGRVKSCGCGRKNFFKSTFNSAKMDLTKEVFIKRIKICYEYLNKKRGAAHLAAPQRTPPSYGLLLSFPMYYF